MYSLILATMLSAGARQPSVLPYRSDPYFRCCGTNGFYSVCVYPGWRPWAMPPANCPPQGPNYFPMSGGAYAPIQGFGYPGAGYGAYPTGYPAGPGGPYQPNNSGFQNQAMGPNDPQIPPPSPPVFIGPYRTPREESSNQVWLPPGVSPPRGVIPNMAPPGWEPLGPSMSPPEGDTTPPIQGRPPSSNERGMGNGRGRPY